MSPNPQANTWFPTSTVDLARARGSAHKCGVCDNELDSRDEHDDTVLGICGFCKPTPKGRTYVSGKMAAANDQAHAGSKVDGSERAAPSTAPQTAAPAPASAETAARALHKFDQAQTALIKQLHASLPAQDLLQILNARALAADPSKPATFTIVQLQEAIAAVTPPAMLAPLSGRIDRPTDWSALRKMLGTARRDGTLDKIDLSVIEAFGVVFALTPRQVITLKDIVLSARR